MKRTARFHYSGEADLKVGKRWSCLKVWGYEDGKLICRLDISRAGIAVYRSSAKIPAHNLNWSGLLERLDAGRKK